MHPPVRYKSLEFIGFPGYRIGDDGSAWSRKRHNCWVRLRGRVDSRGYYQVVLSFKGQPKAFFIHHLILLAFVGPRPSGLECCHGDGDRQNNRPSNLRWDTKKNNTLDRSRHGRSGRFGVVNGSAKLDPPKVRLIRHLYSSGWSGPQLASKFGVHYSVVYSVIHRRTWSHVL